MKVVDSGTITQSVPGTIEAESTFPALVQLRVGTLLMTCRRGILKGSEDEWVELYRSTDRGASWTRSETGFPAARIDGGMSSLRVCYLTEIDSGQLIAATGRVDRLTYPGAPLFNPDTEGCLPLGIFLADSGDGGKSCSDWRPVATPADIGPPSLANPLIKLTGSGLMMTVESNKHYRDRSKLFQRVICF